MELLQKYTSETLRAQSERGPAAPGLLAAPLQPPLPSLALVRPRGRLAGPLVTRPRAAARGPWALS